MLIRFGETANLTDLPMLNVKHTRTASAANLCTREKNSRPADVANKKGKCCLECTGFSAVKIILGISGRLNES